VRIIEGIEALNRQLVNPVITIGNFDGVHLGHQALLAKTVERARAIDGTAMAVTFHPHPVRVLSPSGGPPLLTVKTRKEELISGFGIGALLNIKFTKRFASLTAREFVEEFLVSRIGPVEMVVGYDTTFGCDREGDIDFLKAMGRECGFQVHVQWPVEVDGRPVSSTWARDLIEAGSVAEAIRLLGRPYQISGQVIRGHDRGGRLLGFPTANLKPINEVLPAAGVYAVRAILEDERLLGGVTNIGYSPTFEEEELTVETFVLDFDQDIYEQALRLDFIARLRDERRFSGPEELAARIKADVAQARKILH